jgi:GTP-binding protein
VLVHVLDCNPLDGSDPADNHSTVEREIATYDRRLAALPRVLALSKADLVDAGTGEAARELWSQRLGPEVPVILTSSVTRAGLRELSGELLRLVPEKDEAPPPADGGAGATVDVAELAEHRVFRPAAPRAYRVARTGENSFSVTGAGIDRLVARYDLDNDEALAHLERRLRGIGVLRALEAEGFEAGDEVQIAGILFDLDPNL